ncbi:hypothetical protein F0562_015665 [Nyssa sinensis]|uniref:Uncharacterized protein n=1 Tax=Nyssa sinensis TaxID=561372 RepID=A0A5J4ZM81_9ASTE|nr:hypothetical protein F0562_015665 [Nyssa sinensis]
MPTKEMKALTTTGGGCEDHVVPGEGDEGTDGEGGDEEESGVSGGELADAGSGEEVDGAGVEAAAAEKRLAP